MKMENKIIYSPDDRFHRFKKQIGRGSLKTVYKAFDSKKGIDCTWNQINLDQINVKKQKHLEKEINVMKNLKHFNILKYHDHWKRNGLFCFITDYQSHSLRNFILKRNIRLITVKCWIRQILAGLQHLHKRNIVHRDIKCDNIFINASNGQLVIGDLGLAKDLNISQNGAPMSIVGTPQFMAPEQLKYNSTFYTSKVDIYALGMCLIEIITKSYPYSECKSLLEVITHINEQKECKAFLSIDSKNIHNFVNWFLNKDSELRPTATEALMHIWLCRIYLEDFKYCKNCNVVSYYFILIDMIL
jgi:serine/threonine protein kinase